MIEVGIDCDQPGTTDTDFVESQQPPTFENWHVTENMSHAKNGFFVSSYDESNDTMLAGTQYFDMQFDEEALDSYLMLRRLS